LKDLLIEIGVEELPAIPFLRELKNIKQKYLDALEEFKFYGEVQFYYTPRRIIFYHKSFKSTQDDFVQEFFGAPLEIAYKDNKPTPATTGFAKKCGVSVDELSTTIKNNKEILYYQKKIIGKNINECIGDIVSLFLKSLVFGKNMRWGKNSFSFIRPIRWICAKLDTDTLNFQSYGVSSSDFSYGHRQHISNQINIPSASEYFLILKDNGVIVSQDKRKAMILEQFDILQKDTNLIIHKDNDLLEELVAITEHPQVLRGNFDSKFLDIPQEVIIHTMRENQRYFSLTKDGILQPYFVVIADTIADDSSKILKGNKKVLLARLEDALFFYKNDLKNGFNIELLKNVSFMKNMGSMLDKVNREKKIGKYLGEMYGENLNDIDEVLSIAKADLMSEMVYEFTSMQGIVGSYYAKKFGYKEHIANAIKEQYLPDGQESLLPTSRLSAIVALSNKLDLLFSLFSTNSIPTGSRDPYALRRAIIGVLKIVISNNFSFNIKKISIALQPHYDTFDVDKIIQFYYDRMYQYFDKNNSLISSIIETKECDILEFSHKLEALNSVVLKDGFRENFSTFKRVANMLENDNGEDIYIDKTLFENEFENNLYYSIKDIQDKTYDDYLIKLEALFNLKDKLSDYFDNVLINAKDEKLKRNRRNILKLIYSQFKEIADIKVISI